MNKLRQTLQDYILTQQINEYIYFSKFSQSIQNENVKVLHASFVVVPILYIIITLVSWSVQGSVDSMPILKLFIPEQIIYHILRLLHNRIWSEKEIPGFDAISYYVIFALQIMLLESLGFNHSEAIWFPMLLVLLPMIYIDKLSGYILTDIALTVIYCTFTRITKASPLVTKDILEAVVSLPISLFSALMVSTIRNAQARQNQSLREESSYDKLTGLLNKGAAKKEVAEYFSRRPINENTVVISMDADNFKQINDKLGHSAGDVVLASIGNILKASFRVDDIVARNGGDEFLIVMKGVVPPFHIDTICRRVQSSIANIKLDGGWTFTCSLGVVIDTHNKDFESIFAMADDALYECKIRGRDCFSEWYTYDKLIPVDRPLIILSASREHPNVEEVDEILRTDYSLVYAENGNEVLNLASQYTPVLKVIILDMAILKIPANLVLTYVKQRPTFSHIKVIAACPDQSCIDVAKEFGADEIISVPCRPEIVLDTVKKVLADS